MNYETEKKYKILTDILKGNYSDYYKSKKVILLSEDLDKCVFETSRTCIDIIFNRLIIRKINDEIEVVIFGFSKEINHKYIKVTYDFKNHFAHEIEIIDKYEKIIKDISSERFISRSINPLEIWFEDILRVFWFIYEKDIRCFYCKKKLIYKISRKDNESDDDFKKRKKEEKITLHHHPRFGINSRNYIDFNVLNVFLCHTTCHSKNKKRVTK